MRVLGGIAAVIFSLNAFADYYSVVGLRRLPEPAGKAAWNHATSQCGVYESSAMSWEASVRQSWDTAAYGAHIYQISMSYSHDQVNSFVRLVVRWMPGSPRAEVINHCCGYMDCRLPTVGFPK